MHACVGNNYWMRSYIYSHFYDLQLGTSSQHPRFPSSQQISTLIVVANATPGSRSPQVNRGQICDVILGNTYCREDTFNILFLKMHKI